MQGDLICFLVYRPISFYVTLPMLWLGVPVLGVTFLAFCVAISMVTVAWLGGTNAYLIVAVLGFLYPVLDCVDGNMARTLGRTSRLGAILDGTVDMMFWCLLLLSLGLLVAHDGGGVLGPHAVAFSLGLCVLLLLNRQTRDNFALQNATPTYFKSQRPEKIALGEWLMMSVTGLEFAYVMLIAIGGVFGVLDRVLVGIGVYVAVIFVGAIWMTFAKAAELDRTSASSDPR